MGRRRSSGHGRDCITLAARGGALSHCAPRARHVSGLRGRRNRRAALRDGRRLHAPRASRRLRQVGAAPGHAPGARRTLMLKPSHSTSLARKHVLATRASVNAKREMWTEDGSARDAICDRCNGTGRLALQTLHSQLKSSSSTQAATSVVCTRIRTFDMSLCSWSQFTSDRSSHIAACTQGPGNPRRLGCEVLTAKRRPCRRDDVAPQSTCFSTKSLNSTFRAP